MLWIERFSGLFGLEILFKTAPILSTSKFVGRSSLTKDVIKTVLQLRHYNRFRINVTENCPGFSGTTTNVIYQQSLTFSGAALGFQRKRHNLN
jgi:hypothetical protein